MVHQKTIAAHSATHLRQRLAGHEHMYPKRVTFDTSWIQHTPFAFHLMNELRPRLVVDLGVFTGNSLFAFTQAAAHLHINTTIIGIDTWAGDDHTGPYSEKIFQEISWYQKKHYPEKTHLIRDSFENTRSRFSDGSIDLLHIDGLHTYEAVKNDFMSWLPKLSEQGVILFHDTTEKKDDFGVYRLWDELIQDYPYHFNFHHGHGLGVLYTGKTPQGSLLPLFQGTETQAVYRTFFEELGQRTERPENLLISIEQAISKALHLLRTEQYVLLMHVLRKNLLGMLKKAALFK